MDKKISLIGAGQIGGTLAHLLSIKELADIVLFDVAEGLAKGKALDIAQSTSINGSNINLIGTSSYEDTKNSDVVINLVGILFETKKQKFENVHANFPDLLSKICSDLNIEKFIHISALGINENTSSKYMQSKLIGEKKILNNFDNSIILRPSIVYGDGDNFFNQFASLAEFLPALPLIGGGQTKFQPIYVSDFCKAIVAILNKEGIDQNIYELGGFQIYSFKEMMEILLKQINKKILL